MSAVRRRERGRAIERTGGSRCTEACSVVLERFLHNPRDGFAGVSEDEIAARFFVAPSVVKQRLKLAAVAPDLLDAYAEHAMTLEMLMAFTVCPDHARQVQVWETHQRGYGREAYHIRRMLTEGTVRAHWMRITLRTQGAV